MNQLKYEVEKALKHVGETNSIRKVFWHMDEKVPKLRYGIQQGDDSVIVENLVVNMEGPYPLKIGRKTGLIHTCSDIVVMGAKPLFALNAMQVSNMKEANETAEDIKKQSIGLGVPIIGGNTQMEKMLEPCVSFVVIGKLISKEIPDSGAVENDSLLILGDVIEGEIGERVYRANVKFKTFLEILEKGIDVHASKDCSRGGWFGNLAEMLIKSKKGAEITSVPYPRLSHYMGNYIISVPENEVRKIIEISMKNNCPVVEIGKVTSEQKISIGKEVLITKKRMLSLIKKFPFKKAKF
ncbi:MAG: AIR synthase-related protein [Candidatus Altiarchaeota archaeon]